MAHAVTAKFDFSASWTAVDSDPTAAHISLDVDGLNAFRAENRWSKSIDEAPHLSAFPLAMWLAQSWWRLRWELGGGERPDHGWRMAHELAAAGGGFLWPNLTLVSDGQNMSAVCERTPDDAAQMLRYLADFRRDVSVGDFEQGVDRFLRLVIERTVDTPQATVLTSVWNDVLAERRNTEAMLYRRIEAMLGFDPDTAEEGVIDTFIAALNEMGQQAGMEAISACRGVKPLPMLQSLRDAIDGHQAVDGRIADLKIDLHSESAHPAEAGRRLAENARLALSLDALGPVRDKYIAELIGVSEKHLEDQPQISAISTSISRREPMGNDRIFLAGKRSTGRRFAAARIFCDATIARSEQWRFVTTKTSARQKIQRAFASEFLAPINGLTSYLDNSYDTDSLEGAAEYYDVSPMTIVSHLTNNHVIPYGHPMLYSSAA
jgi:hypothetical protein